MATMVGSTTSSIRTLETSHTVLSSHHSRPCHPRPRQRCRALGAWWCTRDCLAKLHNVLRVSPLGSRAGASRNVRGLPRRHHAVRASRTGTASLKSLAAGHMAVDSQTRINKGVSKGKADIVLHTYCRIITNGQLGAPKVSHQIAVSESAKSTRNADVDK